MLLPRLLNSQIIIKKIKSLEEPKLLRVLIIQNPWKTNLNGWKNSWACKDKHARYEIIHEFRVKPSQLAVWVI